MKTFLMAKDILGTALLAYAKHADNQVLITHSSITEDDEMPVDYFFRSIANMPFLEQKALEISKGTVLDIGCGAGSHALYLQKKGLNVTAIDISKGAIEVSKGRGVKNAVQADVLTFESEKKFDTILVLMNGTGICGKLNNLASFLIRLSNLLTSGGQILIDSSDIIYMFEDEKGEHWIDADQNYYGEVEFSMSYQNKKSDKFDWLYVDYNTLQRCAIYNGLNCELITEGEHYDYLAKITKE